MSAVPVRFRSDSSLSSGVKELSVCDVDMMPMVRRFSFTAGVGSIHSAELSLFCGECDFALPAEVAVSITVLDGYQLDVEALPTGGLRYMSTRKTA